VFLAKNKLKELNSVALTMFLLTFWADRFQLQ